MEQPFQAVTAANDTWGIDFKGGFRTLDGTRCDPLTVTDSHSRYLLASQIMAAQTAPVRAALDALFRAHGLPLSIRCDNGPPFGATAVAGLSRLSVHWIKLGIRVEFIPPGQPQNNGRHERFHRTLKAETTNPPAASKDGQQARFDAFRHDYNHNRPHESLGQQTPAQHYRPSPRPMPAQVPEPWYDADHDVRRVRANGEIKRQGETVFVSSALSGEPVGLLPLHHRHWLLRFAAIDLGILDRQTHRLHGFAPGRPSRTKADTPTPDSVSDLSGP